jgi:hypothetical protein
MPRSPESGADSPQPPLDLSGQPRRHPPGVQNWHAEHRPPEASAAPKRRSAPGYQKLPRPLPNAARVTASRPNRIFMQRRAWKRMPASAADRVERRGPGRTLAVPRGQSAAVNSARRGRRLTGSLSRRANLRLRASAQRAADLARIRGSSDGAVVRAYRNIMDGSSQPYRVVMPPVVSLWAGSCTGSDAHWCSQVGCVRLSRPRPPLRTPGRETACAWPWTARKRRR